MNLETKITIYKFTPQVFTLTLNQNLSGENIQTESRIECHRHRHHSRIS